MDVANEDVRVPLARERVARIARAVLRAERVRDALLSITFVSRRRIAAINRAHLGRSGATDVIAFGLTRTGARAPVVGDVYIAPEVAAANARATGARVREELARLVVHGTLHVLGHDHPDKRRTSSAMWRRQEALVRRMMARAVA